MKPSLLDILCCPITHRPLAAVPADRLAILNQQIAEGVVNNRGGEVLTESLGQALITDDERLVYPVVDGVPVLLEEACIDLASQVS